MADEATTAPDDPTSELASRLAELESQDQPGPQDPEPQAQTEAPSQETSAGTPEETFTNFRLEDVPQEHREYVEKAYKQLQGDYTRKTQSVAEERRQAENALGWFNALQSEETRAQALLQMFGGDEQAVLAALGYETDDPAPTGDPADVDPADPVSQMAREWEQFKAQQQAQAAQAAEEAQLTAIDQSVEQQLQALAEQHGEISDKEKQLIVDHALASIPPGPDDMPQIALAFQDLTEAWTAREKRWAQSKQAPHVPQGAAATQVPELDTERGRTDHMSQRFAEIEAGLGN